jgi:hypothetical protein
LAKLIAQANQGEVIVLTNGQQNVTLRPGSALDLEEDSPELEAHLLDAIDGPYTPYPRRRCAMLLNASSARKRGNESSAGKDRHIFQGLCFAGEGAKIQDPLRALIQAPPRKRQSPKGK